MSYAARFWLALAIASVTGFLVVYFFFYRLGGGDTSVWPQATISFVVFAVSAPAAVYYRSRKRDRTESEKTEEVISRTIKEENDGKK